MAVLELLGAAHGAPPEWWGVLASQGKAVFEDAWLGEGGGQRAGQRLPQPEILCAFFLLRGSRGIVYCASGSIAASFLQKEPERPRKKGRSGSKL